MMSNYVTLMLDDVQARIEVPKNDSGYQNDSPISEAVINLKEQMEPLMKVATYIVDQAKKVTPDELELNFGITVSGEGGVLCFAKAGIEAQFNVTMTWTKPE